MFYLEKVFPTPETVLVLYLIGEGWSNNKTCVVGAPNDEMTKVRVQRQNNGAVDSDIAYQLKGVGESSYQPFTRLNVDTVEYGRLCEDGDASCWNRF